MGLRSSLPVWYLPAAHCPGRQVSFVFCVRVVLGANALPSSPSSQLEAPDPWLEHDNPWELPRADVAYDVRFYGHSERLDGMKAVWSGGQEVLAVAYDVMVPGYATKNTNNLRLWESKPKRGFDLNSFNGARNFFLCI